MSILATNAVYACAARLAARHYGLQPALRTFAAKVAFVAGTAIEIAIVGVQGAAPWSWLVAVTFGAAVTSAATDIECGYVFDAITVPSLVAALAVSCLTHQLWQSVFGLLSAGGSVYALYGITRGRGLGFGDVKLAASIGTGIGAAAGITAVGAAFIFGGVYAAIVLAARRARRGQEMRFAPYLAGGMAYALLFPVDAWR